MINNDNKIKAENSYRILKSFQDANIPVYFKFDSGPQVGMFKNGKIIDISETKLTIIFDEFKDGVVPYFLEHIDADTIHKSEKEEYNE